MKKSIVLIIAVLALMLGGAVVSADSGVYLQFNNQDHFDIYPQWYGTVHATIQVGNMSGMTEGSLQMNCFVDDDYASIEVVNDWSNIARYELFYDRDSNGNNERLLMHSNPTGISIAPWQNWNFQLQIVVAPDAPKDVDINVTCNVRQRDPITGFLPLLASDSFVIDVN